MIGDQMVLAYSKMGLVMALYVCSSVSFCLPHVVPVSALIMLIVFLALVVVADMCLLYVCLGSNVSPSIFGFLSVGMVCCPSLRERVVEYSAGSGVKSVEVDLSVFICNLLVLHQLCISCR